MQRYIDMGYVMPGWTAAGWRGELLRRAVRCRKLKPDLARLYERWAGKIAAKLGGEHQQAPRTTDEDGLLIVFDRGGRSATTSLRPCVPSSLS